MILIDSIGFTLSARIKRAPKPIVEHGSLDAIHGIIVHQTGAATAESTLNSYERISSNGAHFLIDRDGSIYQTASLYKKTWHVGKLKARCVLEKRCTPVEIKALARFNPKREDKRERAKSSPDRFPSNQDSIGIELVGTVSKEDVYESVTEAQNESLTWLIYELTSTLKIPSTEVFRHPVVSRKNPTEASTAKW